MYHASGYQKKAGVAILISNQLDFKPKTIIRDEEGGTWVAQWVKPLPSAQVMISGSWDRALRRALCSAGSLLPPLSLPASLFVICQINKIFFKKLKRNKKNHVIGGPFPLASFT